MRTRLYAIPMGLLFAGLASATVIDLTTSGSSGTLGVGVFVQANFAPSGSGNISSFVRINPGGSQDFEQGYNTSSRPLQYEENNSATFTHDLLLTSVPIFTCGANLSTGTGCTNGVDYREFILDINQSNSDPLLSLRLLQIYQSNSTSLTGASVTDGSLYTGNTLFGPNASLVYNSGSGNMAQLNGGSIDSGSGKGDVFVYIPSSLFTMSNVWLYSEFGLQKNETSVPCADGKQEVFCMTPQNANGGYEEWAVRTGLGNPPDVPEPVSSVLIGTGLASLFFLRRRIAPKA